MIKIIESVIISILTGLYQPFWFALILSIFYMFAWKHYSSLKQAVIHWVEWFKTEIIFRKMFFFTFYTVMILFRTLLNRTMWANPVSNVIGVWGLYMEKNGETVLTTEVLENLALFIPFTILLFWTYRERILGKTVKLGTVAWKSVKITFLFSFSIEMLQLFLRLGTWQLSDIAYNTLGGFIGGLIFYMGYKIKA